MSTSRGPAATVFVGNIPFGVTEDDLKAVFEDVGPVKNIRMVTDRDTGKPKGFAFCEFYDIPTAVSAQRNLHGYEFNGRKLRVDFADEQQKADRKDDGPRDARGGTKVRTMGQEAAQTAAKSAATMLGLPVPVPGGSGDKVTYLLGNKTRTELYEIMSQMRDLVQQNPQQAREILSNNPVLTKTLFQAQIMLGMVAVPADTGGEGPSPAAHPSAPSALALPPALPGPPPGAPPAPPPPPPEGSAALLRPPFGAPAPLANGTPYSGENSGFPGAPPAGAPPAFPGPALPPPLQVPGPPQQMGQGLPPPPPPLGPPRPPGAGGPPKGPFPGVQHQGPGGGTPQYAPSGAPQFPPPSFDPRGAQAQAPNPQYLGGPQQQEPYGGPAGPQGPQGNQAPLHGPPQQPHIPNHGAHVQPGMPSPNPYPAGAPSHNPPPSVNEALIEQIMNLSQEKIDLLAPAQRDQVMKLKQWKLQQQQQQQF